MLKKLSLGNFPTKIEPLPKLSAELGKSLYIKRDDQTGTEFSGNKIRKLEYAVAEALEQGATTLITCGGVQSNHCRATAAAAVRLGLKSILVLRSDEAPKVEGNYLLDLLLGAEIRLISSQDYAERLPEILEDIAAGLTEKGEKGYIMPSGASNGVGMLGYFSAFQEITAQEEAMGIRFDTIVCAAGSGGTYAGLCAANKVFGKGKDILGVCVGGNAAYFVDKCAEIAEESKKYLDLPDLSLTPADIHIVDGYVGRGYALSTPEELAFIRKVASTEGIVVDPVYTGKTLYGLWHEIKKGNLPKAKNILFIHTGGLFGLFPKQDEFGL